MLRHPEPAAQQQAIRGLPKNIYLSLHDHLATRPRGSASDDLARNEYARDQNGFVGIAGQRAVAKANRAVRNKRRPDGAWPTKQ
jgi:hypothetical protein